MALLISKLTGTSLAKPRQPIPYNLWAAANTEIVDSAHDAHCRVQQTSKKKGINVRSTLTRSLFMELPSDVRAEWEAKAKAGHAEMLASWAKTMENPVSTESEDRQR